MTRLRDEPTSNTHAPSAPAAFYRHEADRLRSMATSHLFTNVRDALLQVASQYDILADQVAELLHHEFGRRLTRPQLQTGGKEQAD